MYPILLDNDILICVKKNSYYIDDIVIFKKKSTFIAHRITYINKKNFYAKGDNARSNIGPLKNSLILGKVKYIIRNKTKISLSQIYKFIFDTYIVELKKINKDFVENKIIFAYIKGPVNYYNYSRDIPNYFYCDCDILINDNSFNKTIEILLKNKFTYRKTNSNSNQISFHKKKGNITITLDIHIKPGIFFTTNDNFNKYFLTKKHFSNLKNIFLDNITNLRYFNSTFPVLNTESQLLYLYIHFFHHNFLQTEKLRLTKYIYKKLNIVEFILLVNKTQTKNIIKKSLEIDFFLKKENKIKKIYLILFKKDIPKNIKIDYSIKNKLENYLLRFINVFKYSDTNILKKILIFIDREFYIVLLNFIIRFLRLFLNRLVSL